MASADEQPATETIEDDLITRDELARMYRVSPRLLVSWERDGYGPPVIRLSPRVALYSRRAAVAFLHSNRKVS